MRRRKRVSVEDDFAVWLREFRLKHERTQQEVAEVLGISVPRISEWERRVRTPKRLTIEGIKARLKGE